MLLSRTKAADGVFESKKKDKRKRSRRKKKPKLEDFIKKRDYTGAITLLKVRRRAGACTAHEQHATYNLLLCCCTVSSATCGERG